MYLLEDLKLKTTSKQNYAVFGNTFYLLTSNVLVLRQKRRYKRKKYLYSNCQLANVLQKSTYVFKSFNKNLILHTGWSVVETKIYRKQGLQN